MKATPIMKWAGGKTKLLPRLLAAAPPRYRRYYEPFMGGAAMFFALAPSLSTISDVNLGLVTTYRALARDVDQVMRGLVQHRSRHADKTYYYVIRSQWNAPEARASMDDFEVAAAMIYLNKTCFNGLWRENRSGGFNVPRGDYDDPSVFDEDALRRAGVALATATIVHASFEVATAEAGDGDFVYFDPPYDPLSETSNFTTYSSKPFGKVEQRALAAHAIVLRDRGAFVVASNNDTPLVRELYDGFDIQVAACGRAINSNGAGRGKVNEVIITSRRH